MTRTFAAMFLDEPHGTARRYKALTERLGKDLFVESHRLEPYYVAAFAWYKLEYLFRNQKIETKYKPARWHFLLAARLLANPDVLPRLEANEMENYCQKINEILWDPGKADELFEAARVAVDAAAKGVLDRDVIRTQPFTESLKAECRRSPRSA